MANYPLIGPNQSKLTVGEMDAEGGKTFRQQISPIIVSEESELTSLTPASFSDCIESTVAPALKKFAEAYGGSVEIVAIEPETMTFSYRATGGALEKLEENIAKQAQATDTQQR